ncbi:MAG: FixG Ig-like domain-containing protein [Pseudomonadota bacterium]
MALTLVSALMIWGMTHRSALDVHVLRDRNPMFVRLHDGAIRDGYTLKIANRGFYPKDVAIAFTGPPGARLRTPGAATDGEALRVRVEPNEVRAVRVFVTVPAAAIDAPNMPAAFALRADGDAMTVKTNFLSGAANAR